MRERTAFWTGWLTASLVAVAAMAASAVWTPLQPQDVLLAAVGLAGLGLWRTGGRR